MNSTTPTASGRAATPAVRPAPPTPRETAAALAERSGRAFVPIRKTFDQKPATTKNRTTGRAGPLARLVTANDARGLDALLLVLTATSASPYTVSHPADVWARALNIKAANPSAAMSKVWRRLEEHKLITRARDGRQAQIHPLREDGKGKTYSRPDGSKARHRFLKLNHVYWTDGWYETLTLPGKAMLLIALAEKEGFELPYERAPLWYGLSADTVARGFGDLLGHKLISYDTEYRPEPLSAVGYREVRKWILLRPFRKQDVT